MGEPETYYPQFTIDGRNIDWSSVPTSEPVAGGTWIDSGTVKYSTGIAPAFTTQPSDQSVAVGETATFTVVATNATSYQWQLDSGSGYADVSGATSASYTTSVTVIGDDSDDYRCVATGLGGTTNSNAATLSVSLPTWWTKGDSTAPQIVFDVRESSGITEAGGVVTQVNNLGTAASSDLTPTGSSIAIATLDGLSTINVNGNQYEGAGTYAATVFQSTKDHTMFAAVVQTTTTGDQTPLNIGKDGAGNPRLGIVYGSNGSTTQGQYHPGSGNGSITQYVQGSETRTANEVSVTGVHQASNEATLWYNGELLKLRDSNTLDSMNAPSPTFDKIALGGTTNGVFDLVGGLVATSFDNSTSTLANAFAKYDSLFDGCNVDTVDSFAIWSIGQSNAVADYSNSDPITLTAGNAYFRSKTGADTGLLEDGLTHNDGSIGDSSPAVYFADEWRILQGGSKVPIFQELAFGGQPISPGVGTTDYWLPTHALGTAAGQTSLMTTWADDFQRFQDLLRYSPKFNVEHNIAFIFEGESDANAINNSETNAPDQSTLEGYINTWLDALKAYGITIFAIVNIGRRGTTAATVASTASGVATFRTAMSNVITSRSDSYDVFPHLNHTPDPFVLDDLVVDSDGAWVSGVGSNADGVHYTPEMYQAIGRKAARNLHSDLGL